MSTRTITVAAVAACAAMLCGCAVEPAGGESGQDEQTTTSTDGAGERKKDTSKNGGKRKDTSGGNDAATTAAVAGLPKPSYLGAYPKSGMGAPRDVSIFSPWLDRWVVDGQDVTLVRIGCTGSVLGKKYHGRLEGNQIVWDRGDDPFIGDARTRRSPLTTYTESTIETMSGDPAHSAIDRERQEFAGYCRKTGERVAEIFAG